MNSVEKCEHLCGLTNCTWWCVGYLNFDTVDVLLCCYPNACLFSFGCVLSTNTAHPLPSKA